MLATTPPASRKGGRPKGSRNQKTLAALATAAAAAAAPTATAAVGAAPALGGEGAPRKWGPGRSKGIGKKVAPVVVAAPSSSRCRGRPPGSKNKKTLPALGATASGSTRPRAVASPPAGPSRPQPVLPVLQPLAYTSAEGWSTFIVSVLAGAEVLCRLPTQFMETMEG
jgi:hypothetical protein